MTSPMQQRRAASERAVTDLVYVGFNSRVLALDRYSGELVWQWRSPKGRGFVTILLDGDRLMVSVMGYTHCLDPLFGQEVWANPLPGMGMGVASLASVNGSASGAAGATQQQQQQQQQASGGA